MFAALASLVEQDLFQIPAKRDHFWQRDQITYPFKWSKLYNKKSHMHGSLPFVLGLNDPPPTMNKGHINTY